ncbi:hypothetical protein NC653_003996 [Populus alba x Populus x berolinensis]|uniref:Uncharacterized protein n=1 Tax=Populus alba x Populus x berolinensis TaxID=444605 RepID=A0AAD6RSW7_9ROSI|nr:hypothetical protein NC653_003996 [Populus alba x Populus x berolinensis]
MAFVESLSKGLPLFLFSISLPKEVGLNSCHKMKPQAAQWEAVHHPAEPPQKDDRIQSIVTCDCTFENNTVCHVISFKLKGFNLTGVLPVEFRNLTQAARNGSTGR